jgi:hypothetical protein
VVSGDRRPDRFISADITGCYRPCPRGPEVVHRRLGGRSKVFDAIKGGFLYSEVICGQCGENMTLAVKPRERWTHLPNGERPTMIPYALNEWVCPNKHRRDLTYGESRMFE